MSIYYPTKEQLMDDYFILNLSHQQIAEKYGFKTRQVISRLFKKHNIISKSKSEIASLNFEKKIKKPTKDKLKKLYKSNSISKIAKIYGVHRKVISQWFIEYNIPKTYFKNKINNEILIQELNNFSIKELCIKYKVEPNEIKRRSRVIPNKKYSLDEIKYIISLYNISEKYFARQICNDDPNVYKSILDLTDTHFLQSNKITERIYRLIHNIEASYVYECKKCNSKLKFYTLENGYGHTEHYICRNCITSLSGSSKPSQELFWNLYEKLGSPKNCNFAELNNEKTIYINNKDRLFFKDSKKLNKKRYHIDFILNNRIIEYNGRFWHQDIEKEITKNKFFKRKGLLVLNIMDDDYKKNPEKVTKKCIKFLLK